MSTAGPRSRRIRRAFAVGIGLCALLLGSCALPAVERTPSSVPVPQPTAPPTPAPTSGSSGPVAPTGQAVELVTGLSAPWSVVPLADGGMLVSERDRARVLEVTAAGVVRELAAIPGVEPGGEGGLLGLAVRSGYLYSYFSSSAGDNRIVRFPLTGDEGGRALGAGEEVLTGIPKSRTHNGGRIAFGPDGMLYATAGDAGEPARAQDPASLAGKILRMTDEGGVPADNPTAGSLVYSLGHRNPQGIAWDPAGRLWAAEFGQNTWDELNLIEPGANYGWPTVEGAGGADRGFVDPLVQWPTAEASPSGIAIVGETVFIASLRGQRLWAVDVADPGSPTPHFVGEWGRLRDAVAAPDGSLWVLTNNTDGRGEPRAGDDRLYRVELAPSG